MTPEEKDKKIRAAFLQDATPQEAALETGLPYSDILDWLAIGNHVEEVQHLRMKPKWEAKKLVAKEAATSVKDAQWYLDRKANDEFKIKTDNKTELSGDLTIKWQE